MVSIATILEIKEICEIVVPIIGIVYEIVNQLEQKQENKRQLNNNEANLNDECRDITTTYRELQDAVPELADNIGNMITNFKAPKTKPLTVSALLDASEKLTMIELKLGKMAATNTVDVLQRLFRTLNKQVDSLIDSLHDVNTILVNVNESMNTGETA